MKPHILFRGMHGMGDNIHQRAIIRLLKPTHSITLETSWASLYHDLIDDDFKIVRRNVGLRTQAKNSAREAALFSLAPLPHHHPHVMNVRYVTSTIAATKSGTVMEAMMDHVGLRGRFAEADFRLPLKPEWLDAADALMSTWDTAGKPIMIYRPLLERPEWVGSKVRNANIDQYRQMAELLHQKFFIVSVADLAPQLEWIVGPEFPADVKYHAGELVFEILAAVIHRADLVLTSGGFAAILGPAVETPTISILGGYEPAAWCADGGKFSPYLAIEPIAPCRCGISGCTRPCTKLIDFVVARHRVCQFTSMMSGPRLGAAVESKKGPIDLRAFVAALDNEGTSHVAST